MSRIGWLARWGAGLIDMDAHWSSPPDAILDFVEA